MLRYLRNWLLKPCPGKHRMLWMILRNERAGRSFAVQLRSSMVMHAEVLTARTGWAGLSMVRCVYGYPPKQVGYL